jgi:hypothetical protein
MRHLTESIFPCEEETNMKVCWNHDRLRRKDTEVLVEMTDFVRSALAEVAVLPDMRHMPFAAVLLPDLDVNGEPMIFDPGLPQGDWINHLVRFGSATMLSHSADRFCTVAETIEGGRLGIMVLLSNLKAETSGYFLEYAQKGQEAVGLAERVPMYCGPLPLTD